MFGFSLSLFLIGPGLVACWCLACRRCNSSLAARAVPIPFVASQLVVFFLGLSRSWRSPGVQVALVGRKMADGFFGFEACSLDASTEPALHLANASGPKHRARTQCLAMLWALCAYAYRQHRGRRIENSRGLCKSGRSARGACALRAAPGEV